MLTDDRIEPRLPFEAPSPGLRLAYASFGIAITDKIPMMATTIINSISVKPDVFDFVMCMTPCTAFI